MIRPLRPLLQTSRYAQLTSGPALQQPESGRGLRRGAPTGMQCVPLPGILTKEADVLGRGQGGDGVGMGKGFEGRVVTQVVQGYGPPVDVGDIARHPVLHPLLLLALLGFIVSATGCSAGRGR